MRSPKLCAGGTSETLELGSDRVTSVDKLSMTVSEFDRSSRAASDVLWFFVCLRQVAGARDTHLWMMQVFLPDQADQENQHENNATAGCEDQCQSHVST